MARHVPLNTRYKRPNPNRSFVRILHIFTEGEFTEKEYINALFNLLDNKFSCRGKFQIKIISSKGKSSPKNILDSIKKTKKSFQNKDSNEVWCLIDQDQWPEDDVLILQEGKNVKQSVSIYKVLQSIPKFELWILLHFDKANGVVTAKEVDQKLKSYLPQYNKHLSANLFTLENVTVAINNARLRTRNNHDAQTSVYELVEHMLELAQEGAAINTP